MPKAKVADYKIEGGKHQTTVPFKLINNHIYANAMVNGKGPYQFIFDTGGVNLVTPATAKELGLKSQGDMEVRGAGTSTMKASLTKVKQLKVGDAVVDDQLFIEMHAQCAETVSRACRCRAWWASRPSAASSPASITATRRSR